MAQDDILRWLLKVLRDGVFITLDDILGCSID